MILSLSGDLIYYYMLDEYISCLSRPLLGIVETLIFSKASIQQTVSPRSRENYIPWISAPIRQNKAVSAPNWFFHTLTFKVACNRGQEKASGKKKHVDFQRSQTHASAVKFAGSWGAMTLLGMDKASFDWTVVPRPGDDGCITVCSACGTPGQWRRSDY